MADLFRWPLALLAHQCFEQLSLFMITAVIDSVGIKEKNVSWIDQLDVRDVGRVCLFLPKYLREIQIAIRMIFGNLQAQGREMHHPVATHLCEPLNLSGKHERRRMSEIHKPEITGRMNFAAKHVPQLPPLLLPSSYP